ncbi:hypothetical protein [Hymenobacter norwichensis]|uniref:hypothetical protein n=1 Tax=Hymenobacter norwichensis TaxID=223903 RepID=UPI0003B6DF92|nr:hypothetical protein [Hymenobacter norwichensis]
MRLSHSLLALSLLTATTFSCARRNKNIPEAKSVTVAPAPAPTVAPTAARDLADVMTDELKLRPDQQQKVRAILSSTAEQANTAQKQYAGNRPALMTELKRINASSDKQMQQVLTPTQYQQLKAKQRQMQAQMQSRKGN